MQNYGNNNFSYGNTDYQFYLRKTQEKRALEKTGILCGMAFLFYILIQFLLSSFISISGLTAVYTSNAVFQSAVDTVITMVSILVPFGIAGKKMQKLNGGEEIISFERKVGSADMLLAIVAGAGLCLIASIISSVFVATVSLFGIELKSADVPMPTGFTGIIICLVRVVAAAALAEEIALRGVVMGPLRKHGDKFAIFVASVIFAIMHGNLVQAPFALLAGCVLGYMAVKTGSVWTAVFIHGANNLFSVIVSYLLDYADENVATLIYYFLLLSIIAAGIVAFMVFSVRTKDIKLRESALILTKGEKLRAYFMNVPMILALLYMFYITSLYID